MKTGEKHYREKHKLYSLGYFQILQILIFMTGFRNGLFNCNLVITEFSLVMHGHVLKPEATKRNEQTERNHRNK